LADQQLYSHAPNSKKYSECSGYHHSRDMAAEGIWCTGHFTECSNLIKTVKKSFKTAPPDAGNI